MCASVPAPRRYMYVLSARVLAFGGTTERRHPQPSRATFERQGLKEAGHILTVQTEVADTSAFGMPSPASWSHHEGDVSKHFLVDLLSEVLSSDELWTLPRRFSACGLKLGRPTCLHNALVWDRPCNILITTSPRIVRFSPGCRIHKGPS